MGDVPNAEMKSTIMSQGLAEETQKADGALLTESLTAVNAKDGLKPDGLERPAFRFVKKPVYDILKRIMDIICSLAGLIILLPVFIIMSFLIMIDDPGNPFYAQRRTGMNGKEFWMFKFRSMYKNAEAGRAELLSQNQADGPIFKIKDDPRLTKAGKFIRKTSIDELPQLLNILIGNMALIGPRPLPTYEQAECDGYQSQRLLVKPGLSCYWQISGRSDVSFDEMIRLDLKYIEERSIITDIKIIFRTISVVLKFKGAY